MHASGIFIIIAFGVFAIHHVAITQTVISRGASTRIAVVTAFLSIILAFGAVWVFQAMKYIP